ncbi:MAG: PEP-CTERM sorting domain-containing protein [Terriglobia bacterium]
MQQKTRWTAICLAAGLCAGMAGATTIDTGTDWHTWEITAGSKKDVNALPTGRPWTTSEGFVFSTPDNNVSNMPFFGSQSGLTTGDGEIDVAPPAGAQTAMLLNLGVWNGNYVVGAATVDVKIDGQTFPSVPSGDFWFSSSAPITSVAVLSSTAGDEPFIHAISYAVSSLPQDTGTGGNTSPIPEPATFLLVAAGGLIFLGARRRWFRRQA